MRHSDLLYLQCRTFRQGEVEAPLVTRYGIFAQQPSYIAPNYFYSWFMFLILLSCTFFQTVVTTIVPTHLVKRISTGTIDQAEDPCPQRFAARRPTEERSRRICSAGAILPSHHCTWQWLSLTSIILAPGFCNMQGNQYLLGTWICRNGTKEKSRRGPRALITSLNCHVTGVWNLSCCFACVNCNARTRT